MDENMKKKIWYLIYIAVVLLMVMIPFAGMTVAATNETTENKELAEMPKLKSDGKWNVRSEERRVSGGTGRLF